MSNSEQLSNGSAYIRPALALSTALLAGSGVVYALANGVASLSDSWQRNNITECTYALRHVKSGISMQPPSECMSFENVFIQKKVTEYNDVYTEGNNAEEKQSSTINTYLLPSADAFKRHEEASWQKTKNNLKYLDNALVIVGGLVGVVVLAGTNPELTKRKQLHSENS